MKKLPYVDIPYSFITTFKIVESENEFFTSFEEIKDSLIQELDDKKKKYPTYSKSIYEIYNEIRFIDVSNSKINDLNGIEVFNNCYDFNLRNCNIDHISSNTINYFKSRIASTDEFIHINITGNKSLDYVHFLRQIATDKIDDKLFKPLKQPFDLEINNIRKIIKECEIRWNRSEEKIALHNHYNSYNDFLEEKTFYYYEQLIYQLNKKKEKNYVKLYTDINPFPYGLDGFYETIDGFFYKKIELPNYDFYLNYIKKNNPDINFDFIKNSELEVEKYEKTVGKITIITFTIVIIMPIFGYSVLNLIFKFILGYILVLIIVKIYQSSVTNPFIRKKINNE